MALQHDRLTGWSRLQRISFGGPAAIVTSTGVIVGLRTATMGKAAIAGSLLILALADNLTDSLGLHIYQESEKPPPREAFLTTVANFFTRLLLASSFVALLLIVPSAQLVYVSILWGLSLLAVLSFAIAKLRKVSAASEIIKHCAVALAVIALSQLIGLAVRVWLGDR